MGVSQEETKAPPALWGVVAHVGLQWEGHRIVGAPERRVGTAGG